MRRQPTVTDVAEAAGVSRQTVSNVLNAPDIVKPGPASVSRRDPGLATAPTPPPAGCEPG